MKGELLAIVYDMSIASNATLRNNQQSHIPLSILWYRIAALETGFDDQRILFSDLFDC